MFYLNKSLVSIEKTKNKIDHVYTLLALGLVNIRLNNTKKAESHLKHAEELALELKDYKALLESYINQVELFETKNQYKQALSKLKEYNITYKKIHEEQANKNLAEAVAKYETQKKQLEIERLLERNRVEELKNERKLYLLLVAILLLLVGAFNWRRAIKQRQKAMFESKEKSDFLAMMSHELRTPMNGVIGAASILEKSDTQWQRQQTVSIIKSSGDDCFCWSMTYLIYLKLKLVK